MILSSYCSDTSQKAIDTENQKGRLHLKNGAEILTKWSNLAMATKGQVDLMGTLRTHHLCRVCAKKVLLNWISEGQSTKQLVWTLQKSSCDEREKKDLGTVPDRTEEALSLNVIMDWKLDWKKISYRGHYWNNQGYLTMEGLLDNWIALISNFLSIIIMLWSYRTMSFFLRDSCCNI